MLGAKGPASPSAPRAYAHKKNPPRSATPTRADSATPQPRNKTAHTAGAPPHTRGAHGPATGRRTAGSSGGPRIPARPPGPAPAAPAHCPRPPSCSPSRPAAARWRGTAPQSAPPPAIQFQAPLAQCVRRGTEAAGREDGFRHITIASVSAIHAAAAATVCARVVGCPETCPSCGRAHLPARPRRARGVSNRRSDETASASGSSGRRHAGRPYNP